MSDMGGKAVRETRREEDSARRHSSLMKFPRPSWLIALPSGLLLAGALIPFGGVLVLRYTLYALLAYPLTPIIRSLGWVYRDKPMFLTPSAAVFAATVWAVGLYLLLCTIRYLRYRERDITRAA